MRGVYAVLLLLATESHAAEQVLAKKTAANVRVKLVAARISETRGQNLEAKFAIVDAKGTTEIVVRFPGHSYTTHEATLMAVIRFCVDWTRPKDHHAWHKATVGAEFSVPKDAQGRVFDFSHWWLVRLYALKSPTAGG